MSVVCNTCFKAIVQSCNSILRIVLGLDPNKNLVAYITDKFGTIYKQGITTDAEGTVFIDTTNFPQGFNNANASQFKLTFKEKEDNCDLFEFADPCDEEKIYTCIIITPSNIINTNNGGFLQVENAPPDGGYLEQENGGKFIV